MSKKIVVLGAGMVGRTIAKDLATDYKVLSADISDENLSQLKNIANIQTQKANLTDEKIISDLIQDADCVVGAVPGFMGFETLKTILKNKKQVVDISFFPEDAFLLDELAKQNSVTAIVDCGVAPGMDNIILGYHNQRMKIENFECLVGGLPFERKLPFQYKAPFSPIDVIEEYTRPARLVENFETVTRPALTEPEFIHFENIGTLESFNSDGLRSILKTMKIKNMKEKTLRYPGHREAMEMLRDMGFFSEEEISVKGKTIRPIDVAAAIMLPQWKYKTGEEEFTAMRVTVEGNENGKNIRYTYDLFDQYDKTTQTSSMARTTGFTCTAAVRLLLEKNYSRKGINPPEYLGEEETNFQFMLNELKKRNVIYKMKKEEI
ncbi:saccharopine reductase [Bacteroidota bacterium]|nr:saccharopine reductase [Bacteroidota bacterium]